MRSNEIFSMKNVLMIFSIRIAISFSESILMMRFPLVFTVLLVSCGLVLYIISVKTENEASNIPEMSSWKGKQQE